MNDSDHTEISKNLTTEEKLRKILKADPDSEPDRMADDLVDLFIDLIAERSEEKAEEVLEKHEIEFDHYGI